MRKLSSFILALILLVAVAAPTYAQVAEKPLPVTDPTTTKPTPVPVELRPTDTAVLKMLSDNNIDVAYVKKVESGNPYSEKYESVLGDGVIEVFTQTPMYNADGDLIEVGFYWNGHSYVSKTNTFRATITRTTVSMSVLNDQPDGAKSGDSVTWTPALFVGGVQHYPTDLEPILYSVDPYNDYYRNNVLEWDYGVCKRQVRIIEGMLREWWVFNQDPKGEVRIQHNQFGLLDLRIGEATGGVGCYVENDDVEIVPSMAGAEFPVTVMGAAVYYPDAHVESSTVDGYVGFDGDATWTTARNNAGTTASSSATTMEIRITADVDVSRWINIRRMVTLFDTSGLPDDCSIDTATLSVWGTQKGDTILGGDVEINVYSASPTSNTNLVAGDYVYTKFGTTEFSTTITQAAFSLGGWNDFDLNASGIAAISKTGVSKFGFRDPTYDVPNTSPQWNASVYGLLQVFTAEQGLNRAPKLLILYTEPPTVTTDAATAVGSDSATLHGNITDLGGANVTEIRFDWGETVAYGTNWANASVNISANGTDFDHDTGATLSPGTTYHFRASARNSAGWGYGSDRTFTTSIIAPTVTTQAATYVSSDGARVNGLLVDDGGDTCSMRFQYYPPAGGWGTATSTAWIAGFTTGQTHYEDLTGLTGNTTYTFRVQAFNGNSTVDGNALTFTTSSETGDPSNLRIYVATDEPALVLSWTKGTGTADSIVRYQEGSYPTTSTDGLSGGYPTTGSAKLSDLSTGTTYYVRIWGRAGNETSTGYTQAMATTYAPPSSGDQDAPTTPSLWFISTDYTRFSDLPLYAQLNDFFDSLSIPRGTGWFLGAILLCGAVALAVLVKSKNGIAAMIVLAIALLICVVLRLLPLWMGVFVALAILAASKMLSDQRQGGSYV